MKGGLYLRFLMYRSIRSLISLSQAFELLKIPPSGQNCVQMPDPIFLQNWPSVKPRPCRPFFSHSHAKVNYLPLASPYLKIEHLYSAGKTGHYRFWFPLIPHSQPSKVQMVVTGLPVGGGGGGRGRGRRGGKAAFQAASKLSTLADVKTFLSLFMNTE